MKIQPSLQSKPGSLFADRYQILSVIGEGAMGKVFLVKDLQKNASLALKMMRNQKWVSESKTKRFLRESQILCKLKHPNIINIHDFGKYKDTYYFTMDFINGVTLDQYIKQENPSFQKRVTILISVLEGLWFSHQKGIIHRDLKPDNILIDSQGLVIITDFGISRDNDESLTKLTKTGDILGTPKYMSPEQVRGEKVTIKSDLYTAGTILYELLAERLPFEGNLNTLMWKISHEKPVPLHCIDKNISRKLSFICAKSMRKDDLNRYENTEEMANDLKSYLRGDKIKIDAFNWLEIVPLLKKHLSLLFTVFLIVVFAVVYTKKNTYIKKTALNVIYQKYRNKSNKAIPRKDLKGILWLLTHHWSRCQKCSQNLKKHNIIVTDPHPFWERYSPQVTWETIACAVENPLRFNEKNQAQLLNDLRIGAIKFRPYEHIHILHEEFTMHKEKCQECTNLIKKENLYERGIPQWQLYPGYTLKKVLDCLLNKTRK
ncbi:serine/threonine protein kinase [Candidatus Uabimicrobium sp. HlEnr_7]|uniref:serine/threonine protein kinase n=1 Tax=Candidatus Uabimicrobium helgolandensis TaxID=3095367 RepID=UPI0035572B64